MAIKVHLPTVRMDVNGQVLRVLEWRLLSILLAAGLFWLGGNRAAGQLPVARLQTVFPPGAKVGSELDVRIAGNDLDDVTSLVFSHTGITATPKTAVANDFLTDPRPVPGRFIVRIADDVPTGLYEIRAQGRFGLSNPRAFLVGTLQDIVIGAENFSRETAQEVQLGTTINGRATKDRISFYKFSARKGQRILAECWAERIDSRMDPTLTLWEPDGHRIRPVRNTIGKDPLLDVVASQDGEYVLGLHDDIYQGGDEYFFRLSFDSNPHIDFIWPPVGLPGTTGSYTVYGRQLPDGEAVDELTVSGVPLEKQIVEITIPDDVDRRYQLELPTRLDARGAGLDGTLFRINSPQGASNAVAIGYASAPVTLEMAPNNEPDQTQHVAVPCEYVGRIYPHGDHDWISLNAEKGDIYWIDVLSHRLGNDIDPDILIQKVVKSDDGSEKVSQVGKADDSGGSGVGTNIFDTRTNDPVFRLVADQTATYRIRVRDKYNNFDSDPRLVYRMVIRKAQPDFRLAAYSQRIKENERHTTTAVLRRGGAVELQVDVLRQDGFEGAVEVTAEGLPEGVSISTTTLRRNLKTGTLILVAAEDAPAWAGNIQIVGRATVNGQELVRYARSGSLVWTTKNFQQDPPRARLVQSIGLSVLDKDTLPVTVQLGEQPILETSRGANLEIPVKVARRGDFKTEIEVSAVGLPGEMKPEAVKVSGEDGKLKLTMANEKIQPGTYSFFLKGTSKFNYVRNADAVQLAEQDQKQLDQVVGKLTGETKLAEEKKTAAGKAIDGAMQKLQQAQEGVKTVQQTLQQADQRIEQVKKATETLQSADNQSNDEAKKNALNDLMEAAKFLLGQAEEDRKQTAAKVESTRQQLAAADTEVKAAMAEKEEAEKASAAVAAKLENAKKAKEVTDKHLEEVRKANQPKENSFQVISTALHLHVTPVPITVEMRPTGDPLKAGGKLEIPVSLQRKYGFSEAVELSLEPPKGFSASAIQLAKDQAESKFEVTAEAGVPAGEHAFTVRAKLEFNGLKLETTERFVLKTEPAE